ncbi:MAG: TrbM/KikA/MpfK family conjugal transfer protein [Klebsiella pneumoniae]|nr:TrbM/KikA/MpfK family conjugal transfer protein [Klebsiella pneumoniae]
MKHAFLCAALAAALFSPLSHAADEYDDYADMQDLENIQIKPKAPCTVFICMSEKLYGEHSKECEPVISYFFSLKKFGRHGFDPWKTLKKRQGVLNSCPAADPAHVSKILAKFGRMRG